MNRKAVSLVLGGAMLISAVSGMNAGYAYPVFSGQ